MISVKGNGNRKKRGQQKLNAYYIVLSIIAVLLVFIVAFLEHKDMQEKEEPAVSAETGVSEVEPEGLDFHQEYEVGPSEEEASDVTVPVQKPVVEKPVSGSRGSLIFVIDDVGNSLEQLDRFLKIPGPVVFAVMPERRYTEESVKRIKASGKMVIVHQPMEPVGNADPGKGAIYVDMDEDEIIKTLEENLRSVGPVTGINNHMGSKVTTDPETMKVVLNFLKERKMFFLDSVTNTNLVGSELALEIGVPYLKRNSMFLDNESDRESVLSAIKKGQETAEKKGHAVMIGHVMTESLAELLMELYPTFMEDGFTVKDLSDLLHGEYDVSAWD